jgi:hypothetical protein
VVDFGDTENRDAMKKTDKSERDQRGSLKIPADLKREIKVACAMHGLTEYKLIREMWDFWKQQHGENWGPTISRRLQNEEEEELCNAVLDFWRAQKAGEVDLNGIGAAILNAFIERYRSRGS